MCKVEVNHVDGVAIAPPEMVANRIKSWEHSIVGFFVSKRHPFSMVRRFLGNRKWLKEPLDIKLEGSLFFLSRLLRWKRGTKSWNLGQFLYLVGSFCCNSGL